jgi:hypothetical protein
MDDDGRAPVAAGVLGQVLQRIGAAEVDRRLQLGRTALADAANGHAEAALAVERDEGDDGAPPGPAVSR